jgi:hypothetical protein
MFAFLIIGAIAGMLLGLRFNVFALVPAILLAIIAIALSDLVNRQSVAMIVLTVFATVVLLQIGYVVGRLLKVAAQAYLPTRTNVPYRGSKSELTRY